MHLSYPLTADPEVHAQLTSTGNSRQGSIGRRPRNSPHIGGYLDWTCKTVGQGWCSRSPVQESRTCSPPIPSTVIIHCDSAWSGAYNCVCQRASLPSQQSRQSQLEQRVREHYAQALLQTLADVHRRPHTTAGENIQDKLQDTLAASLLLPQRDLLNTRSEDTGTCAQSWLMHFAIIPSWTSLVLVDAWLANLAQLSFRPRLAVGISGPFPLGKKERKLQQCAPRYAE